MLFSKNACMQRAPLQIHFVSSESGESIGQGAGAVVCQIIQGLPSKPEVCAEGQTQPDKTEMLPFAQRERSPPPVLPDEGSECSVAVLARGQPRPVTLSAGLLGVDLQSSWHL